MATGLRAPARSAARPGAPRRTLRSRAVKVVGSGFATTLGDLNFVTVSGSYVSMSGAPAVGTVTFLPSTRLVDSAQHVVLLPEPFYIPLDVHGNFSIDLPATDDPDISPTGWGYTVEELFDDGLGLTYSISVPLASPGGVLWIDDAMPPPDDALIYTQFVTSDQLATGLAEKLDVSADLSDVADAGSSRANLHVPVLGAAQAVSTVNQALTGQPVIDGYQTTNDDVVLLVAQTNPAQDGPWKLPSSGTGAWARPADFASGLIVKGRLCPVIGGSTYAGSLWSMTSTGLVTVDTTSETWKLISGNVGQQVVTGPGGAPGGNTGAAITLPSPIGAYDLYSATLSAATPVITLPAPVSKAVFTLQLVQDGTGGRVPSFAGSVVYPTGQAQWLTSPGAINELLVFCVDGSHWEMEPITGAGDMLPVSVTADYSANANEYVKMTGSHTVTPPTTSTGAKLGVLNAGTGTVTVGAPITKTLVPGEACVWIYDGAAWTLTNAPSVSDLAATGTANSQSVPRGDNKWWQPRQLGLMAAGVLAETCDRTEVRDAAAPTSGTARGALIWLPKGLSITNLKMGLGATGVAASGTALFYAILDSSAKLLAVTADNGSGAVAASAVTKLAISGGPYVIPADGLYYIVLQIVNTTNTGTWVGKSLTGFVTGASDLAPHVSANVTGFPTTQATALAAIGTTYAFAAAGFYYYAELT